MVFGFQCHYRQAQRFQPGTGAGRGRHQHHIRLERHDSLDVRVHAATQLGQGLHAGRVVGITVDPHQPLALRHGAHAFRQRRQQADNTLRRLRQRDGDTAVVRDLQGMGRTARRIARQRYAPNKPSFHGTPFK